ncbi:pimeloyl-ACP methyl ester carboxylesterase [Nonlabens dokdonensis]|uniref:Pimeloyl-ACP methyl ester carboxylesterase n=2 Tax=Nonlabens dokdonensis TaxID=328515 RepID=A0ABX5Q2Z4_9FLAO|nr:alpha/beta fold hydrolase [Nonlabens dokdonensis]AGC76747.1 putative hydrolase (Alpha/beta hydrolase superfamily) [Nonlabens dokdonensis DSW-6]PZX44394.1 pimeloyl-ACP methyl ester carboxylesterase [Nonlabens dokdonensis]
MLHSIILGEGQPFLILHGFLGMADNWKTLGRKWSEMDFQVHLIDQRNHGRSLHSDTFDYAIMAQDIKEYCDAHQLENIVLLGHSMGGKVAMQFASLYSSYLEKLIIADIAPKEYAPHHSDIINGLRSINFDQVSSRNDADEMLEKVIPDFGTRQFLLKSLYRVDKKKYGWRFNLKVLGDAQDRVGTHQKIENQITTPTLFIRGGNSGYILDNDLMVIEHAFAKAELKTIEGAGHWLHAEKPQEFLTIVTNFIK